MILNLRRAYQFCKNYLAKLLVVLVAYQILALLETYLVPLYLGILFSRIGRIQMRNLQFHMCFLALAGALYGLDYLGNCFLDPYVENEMNLSRTGIYASYHRKNWFACQTSFPREEQVNRMHYGVMGNTYTWSSVVTLIQKIAIFVIATDYAGKNDIRIGVCFVGLIVVDILVIFFYQRVLQKQNRRLLEENSRLEGVEYDLYMKTEALQLSGILSEAEKEFQEDREAAFSQRMKKGGLDGFAQGGLFLLNSIGRCVIFDLLGGSGQQDGTMPAMDQAINVSTETCNELHEPVERLQTFGGMTERLVEFLYSDEKETQPPARGRVEREGDRLFARDISLRIDGRILFTNVSFELKRGELTALTGPNGCGKTSLLRSLCGVYPGLTGALSQEAVAYAPADEELYYGTVRHNVRSGSISEDETEPKELYSMTGMDLLQEQAVSRLSTGQKQRVNFMRALAKDADVLLLDEIFANVDYQTAEKMAGILRQRKAFILCTIHDQALLPLFDKVYALKSGQIIEA